MSTHPTGREEELADDWRALAERAGIAIDWTDYQGQPQTVSSATLQKVLAALGHPCDTPEARAASLAALATAAAWPPLVTGRVGEPLMLPLGLDSTGHPSAELLMESGETRQVVVAIVAPPAHGLPAALSVGAIDTPGYHRLMLALDGQTHRLTLAIAPRHAFRVDDALAVRQPHARSAAADGPPRIWGTAVQLYGLRPESTRPLGDAGIGDFSALAAFVRSAAEVGAHAVAISPTHAGFAALPGQCSPYAPSSRLCHNVLHIDPAAVFGTEAAQAAARDAGVTEELAALQGAEQIDWARSGEVKRRWLRALFEAVEPTDPAQTLMESRAQAADFERYGADQGDTLVQHARFEALHAHFQAQGLPDWRHWPEAFRDPASAEVADFVRTHAREVRFHAFLQWLADTGLKTAQKAARQAGMAIGLVSDLAVGMDGAGSHAWSRPGDLLTGLEVGAPPDQLNTDGQTWGLTAFSPRALVDTGFAPFIATLRTAVRHAGGVRIDHVLGLKRLWLVPQGGSAGEGAYVHYPFDDLLNLLALESHRHDAIVIGEDLGTVPPGLRERMADLGLLGMRVLWFERDPASPRGAAFLPPGRWPRDALALTTTHDLPTAAGWWLGRDIDWRERLGMGGDAAEERASRARDRAALAAASDHAHVLHGEVASLPLDAAVDLAIDHVAATPAALAIVPVEDLLGLVEQPNLPGTVDQHPNWRRRLPLPADRVLAAPLPHGRAARLRHLRGGRAPA